MKSEKMYFRNVDHKLYLSGVDEDTLVHHFKASNNSISIYTARHNNKKR